MGTRARVASVSTQFRVLPNFHECFYNVWEHRKKCFLFLLKNNPYRKLKRGNSLLCQNIISPYCSLWHMRWSIMAHVFHTVIETMVFRQPKLTFSKCYFIMSCIICFFQTPHNPHLPTLREKAILLCRMMPNYEKRFPEDFELHAQYLELINYVYRYREFPLKLRLHMVINRLSYNEMIHHICRVCEITRIMKCHALDA